MQRIPLKPLRKRVESTLITALLTAIFVVSVGVLDVDFTAFFARLDRSWMILRSFWTIDFRYFGILLEGMLISVSISFVSLGLGTAIAIVLAFLAARTIAPFRLLSSFIRGSVAVIRAVPTLVWALMIIASFGFGNIGGVFTLLLSTVGFLTKMFMASIEELGVDTIEALRATGAPWLAIVVKGLLPGAASAIITWIAIRGETSIGESINLGVIGITGIGFTLTRSIARFQYGQITLGILIIFVSMYTVEMLSQYIKKRVKQGI